MVLLIIAIFILLPILGFLFTRIHIAVDTLKKTFYAGFIALFAVQVVSNEKGIRIWLKILGIPFRLHPMKWILKKDTPIKKAPPRKRTPIRRNGFKLATGKALLASFKLRYLFAEIDTGNFTLNAQLIPIVQTLNGQNRNVSVNFNNQNTLICTIESRGIIILWNVIKSKINHKNKNHGN